MVTKRRSGLNRDILESDSNGEDVTIDGKFIGGDQSSEVNNDSDKQSAHSAK